MTSDFPTFRAHGHPSPRSRHSAAGQCIRQRKIVHAADMGPHRTCQYIDDLDVPHGDSTPQSTCRTWRKARNNINNQAVPVACSTRRLKYSITRTDMVRGSLTYPRGSDVHARDAVSNEPAGRRSPRDTGTTGSAARRRPGFG